MSAAEHAFPDAAAFPWRTTVHGPQETADLGRRLAGLLVGGEVILLHGDLGAGKTCFAQGLCRGLGVEEEVVSPTFTLVNSYRGRLAVHHLDFYRVEPGDDLEDIGVPDILDEVESGTAVLIVEWPERILGALGGDGLRAEWLAESGPGPQDRTWRLKIGPELPESWRPLVEPAEGD